MGVTIHFEGQLKSENDYNKLLQTAVSFAETNNMPYSLIAEENKLLERVKDEDNWDYQGPVKGIKIQPNENADPLWLEFDGNLYVQDFCKTQFAPLAIHVKIIELFEKIETAFVELSVEDEGEFWHTHDLDLLSKHLDECFEQMEKAKQTNAKVSGPYRFENGRIYDLIEG